MPKQYKEQNVYDASIERLDYIFANFERIYLSFSGGKDSGVMLNLVLQYMRERGITRKIGIQILDNEANYEYSCQFMQRMLDANLDLLDVYWCCMPVTLPCTVSSYEIDWQCWGEKDRHRWIRPMPEHPYVVNLQNHPFGDAFRENMHYDEFWDMFAEWYSQGKTTANLIGIRTDESLNRFRAIMNSDKEMHDRMASTIRHNRARGSHNIELMSVIVAELVEMGKGDRWICEHIGMSPDELLRLKQITGVAALFQNQDFSQSWDAEDFENAAADD